MNMTRILVQRAVFINLTVVFILFLNCQCQNKVNKRNTANIDSTEFSLGDTFFVNNYPGMNVVEIGSIQICNIDSCEIKEINSSYYIQKNKFGGKDTIFSCNNLINLVYKYEKVNSNCFKYYFRTTDNFEKINNVLIFYKGKRYPVKIKRCIKVLKNEFSKRLIELSKNRSLNALGWSSIAALAAQVAHLRENGPSSQIKVFVYNEQRTFSRPPVKLFVNCKMLMLKIV